MPYILCDNPLVLFTEGLCIKRIFDLRPINSVTPDNTGHKIPVNSDLYRPTQKQKRTPASLLPDAGHFSPKYMRLITTSRKGRSFSSVETAAMRSSTSMPSVISPKTVYCPSR